MIIKLPLCSICLGPCYCYANTTDFMIIATKTRIRVMYATKSSKSNSPSSELAAVEFIAGQNHKLCILEFGVQSSPFQKLRCTVGMLSRRIHKCLNCYVKLSDKQSMPIIFTPTERNSSLFRYWMAMSNWVRYWKSSFVIKVIIKDISCSVFEVRRSLKAVTSQMT